MAPSVGSNTMCPDSGLMNVRGGLGPLTLSGHRTLVNVAMAVTATTNMLPNQIFMSLTAWAISDLTWPISP